MFDLIIENALLEMEPSVQEFINPDAKLYPSLKEEFAEYKSWEIGPNQRFLPGLKNFYDDPQPYRMEPFRIFGNLWYVGDKKVCSHLIDTGDGLILFDTGYGASAAGMLPDSIVQAGFNVKDIRYIIHSHGHFDHFGCGNTMWISTWATIPITTARWKTAVHAGAFR